MKKYFHAIITNGLLVISTLSATAQAGKIILSSRSFHPNSATDTLSTTAMVKALNITQIDWVYDDNPNHLNQLKSLGVKYSLAMNPQIADSAGANTIKTRIVDINGKPYVAPWMRTWKGGNTLYWGCVNNPMFADAFYKRAVKLIDLGAYAIFVDEGIFNAQLQHDSPNAYGCFCNYCVHGFKDYLIAIGKGSLAGPNLKRQLTDCVNNASGLLQSKNEKDLLVYYQQYQVASVIKFVKNWKSRILAYHPGIITLANNSNAEWDDIYAVYDGGIAELSPSQVNVPSLNKLYNRANQLKKSQVLSLVSNDISLQYYLLCYNFLQGRTSMLPWDVYISGDSPRYFVKKGQISKIVDLVNNYTVLPDGGSSGPFTNLQKDNSMLVKRVKNKLTNENYVVALKEYPYNNGGLVSSKSKLSSALNSNLKDMTAEKFDLLENSRLNTKYQISDFITIYKLNN
jgi:hypothetical protein